jgi:hypothetical protein
MTKTEYQLTLSPEALTLQKSGGQPRPPAKQKRVVGEFYLCPIGWADRAAAVLTSQSQLIIAFRLYRHWRMRKHEEDVIVASNLALAGSAFSREAKRRTLQRLEAAGLIEIVERHATRAPRIRIIEGS